MKAVKGLMIIMIWAFFLMSCSDDNKEVEGVFSSEEASKSLDDFSTTMHTDIVDMVNSTGTEALTDLVDLISDDNLFSGRLDTDMAREGRILQRVRQIRKVFIPTGSVQELDEDERFDFEANKGVYNYDVLGDKFIKTEDVIDHIQINFPSKGSTTNNAILRLLNYTDVLIELDEFSNEYLPTILIADLSVDETIVVSLDLEVNWNSKGLPEGAEVTLFIIPFDYVLNFSNTASTNSILSFSVNKDNVSIIGTNVSVAFKTEIKEDVVSISGDVFYREYTLRGELNIVGLEEAEDGNINDYINLAFYQGDNKIGDVMLEESVNGEDLNAYIVYTDGSKELLETVLQPILDELESFLNVLEG